MTETLAFSSAQADRICIVLELLSDTSATRSAELQMWRWFKRTNASAVLSLPPYRSTIKFYTSKAETREPDYAAAREWFKTFNAPNALRDVGEVTYSRSSGPGGQNVNKYVCPASLYLVVPHVSQGQF